MISDKLFAQGYATDSILLKDNILRTLGYYHVFRHPLYVHEIHAFLQAEVSQTELQHTLDNMVREEHIFYAYNMYSLENSSQIFLKRLVGADMAAEKMMEARRCAALIASFPFVRAVCVSGSLSKGYADENSDIDFFIITTRQRLWICRTLLHIFKKFTFIVNRQHSFCMNYFIDESRLCLEEKNLFTATELATLVPVYNKQLHSRLLSENEDWMKGYFPNMEMGNKHFQTISTKSIVRKSAEWLLNILWPERMNMVLMHLTDRLWRRKWKRKDYPMDDYEIAMKTKWYVSKQHPLNYQKKVLEVNNKPALQF